MGNQKYFDIPSKKQLRNARNREILNFEDSELYEKYDHVYQGIILYGHVPELEYEKDIELIEIKMKRRGLKIPGLLYKMNIHPFKEKLFIEPITMIVIIIVVYSITRLLI